MDKESLTSFYSSHKGGINGMLIGIVIAVILLILGPIRTLIIALFAGIGYYIGKRITDDKDYIKNLLDRILPPGTYR
ncbi:MAG TPA: DUF2273 domain-containing protein [Clostridia bacterium]|nr:DUF2273 domain-containing protein [Clostridia bacterium]